MLNERGYSRGVVSVDVYQVCAVNRCQLSTTETGNVRDFRLSLKRNPPKVPSTAPRVSLFRRLSKQQLC